MAVEVDFLQDLIVQFLKALFGLDNLPIQAKSHFQILRADRVVRFLQVDEEPLRPLESSVAVDEFKNMLHPRGLLLRGCINCFIELNGNLFDVVRVDDEGTLQCSRAATELGDDAGGLFELALLALHTHELQRLQAKTVSERRVQENVGETP